VLLDCDERRKRKSLGWLKGRIGVHAWAFPKQVDDVNATVETMDARLRQVSLAEAPRAIPRRGTETNELRRSAG
jgi:hypothetical protein